MKRGSRKLYGTCDHCRRAAIAHWNINGADFRYCDDHRATSQAAIREASAVSVKISSDGTKMTIRHIVFEAGG